MRAIRGAVALIVLLALPAGCGGDDEPSAAADPATAASPPAVTSPSAAATPPAATSPSAAATPPAATTPSAAATPPAATSPPTTASPSPPASPPAAASPSTKPSPPAKTSPPPSPSRPSERDRLSSCLTKEGYRLQGGAPQATADTEAPDYQIIFSGPRGGGYIGFYKNASRAQRVGAQLRENAQRTRGASVERHGAINIVWVDMPDPVARAGVRSCLVT
jgi:hypothetical protein